jgi:photosystem II stability/assembly factor-like uncharacterized protein
MSSRITFRQVLDLIIISGLLVFSLPISNSIWIRAAWKINLTSPLPSSNAVESQNVASNRILNFQPIITPTLTTSDVPEWRLAGFFLNGVMSIAFSPNYTADQTLLVGTNEDIYRSIDGGVNWTAVKAKPVSAFPVVAFSPDYATDQTMFGGSDAGVYRSTDKGATWTNVGLSSEPIRSLAISPNYANDRTIFAGTYPTGTGSGRIYRSTNGGDNWQDLGFGFTGFTVRALAISPGYASDQTIFAGIGQDWNWFAGGIYRSTDGGDNWSSVNSGLTYKEVHGLDISPNYANDKTLFVTLWSGGVYRSTNGGDTWQEGNNGNPNRRPHAITFSPNYANDQTVYLGTWGENANGGIYRSTDEGASWSIMRDGLLTLWIHQVALPPNYDSNPFILAGGEEINGGGLWIYELEPPIKNVYLPIILRPGLTHLYVKSLNTGGINPLEIRNPNNGNALLLNCAVGSNTVQFCGSFLAIGTYRVIAHTTNCGVLQQTFHDALPGATVTREIGCN